VRLFLARLAISLLVVYGTMAIGSMQPDLTQWPADGWAALAFYSAIVALLWQANEEA